MAGTRYGQFVRLRSFENKKGLIVSEILLELCFLIYSHVLVLSLFASTGFLGE